MVLPWLQYQRAAIVLLWSKPERVAMVLPWLQHQHVGICYHINVLQLCYHGVNQHSVAKLLPYSINVSQW